jgi:putative membrane protein
VSGDLTADGFKRVFGADGWWGIAAIVWIITGILRLVGRLEKGANYYFQNDLFLAKMGLLALILLLELAPMVTLIRWRLRRARGAAINTHWARRLAAVSYLQAALIVLMVVAATGMARGFGVRAP